MISKVIEIYCTYRVWVLEAMTVVIAALGYENIIDFDKLKLHLLQPGITVQQANTILGKPTYRYSEIELGKEDKHLVYETLVCKVDLTLDGDKVSKVSRGQD